MNQDALSRRAIWDILLSERSKRTIILTTHFLDEVDSLADHVVILSRGHLKCEGSTVELKSRYAGGYKVHLYNDHTKDFRVDGPNGNLVEKTVLDAADSAAVMRLLTELESKGHSDVSITGPTMEDVFLTVSGEAAREQYSEDPFASGLGNQEPMAFTTEPPSNLELSSGTVVPFWSQMRLLFLKRTAILLRNWWPYLIAVGIPIIVTPALKPILVFLPHSFLQLSCCLQRSCGTVSEYTWFLSADWAHPGSCRATLDQRVPSRCGQPVSHWIWAGP